MIEIRFRCGGLIKSRWILRQINHNVLHLSIVLQNNLMGLAADSRLLVSAEWRAGRDGVIRVHPHTACFDCAADTDSPVDIAGLHGTAQSVLTLIGHMDDLLLILKFHHNCYRSEDLFLRNPHVVRHIYQQCRL